jgi:hypothetical protein
VKSPAGQMHEHLAVASICGRTFGTWAPLAAILAG